MVEQKILYMEDRIVVIEHSILVVRNHDCKELQNTESDTESDTARNIAKNLAKLMVRKEWSINWCRMVARTIDPHLVTYLIVILTNINKLMINVRRMLKNN